MAAVDKADSAQFTRDEIVHPGRWVLLNYLMTKESQGVACQDGVPNISPLNAKGCWPAPKTFVFPPVDKNGNYPGINNKNLKPTGRPQVASSI